MIRPVMAEAPKEAIVRQPTELEILESYDTEPLGYRIITAYNAVESQTDSEPCIAASGKYVCGTDKTICASNEIPMGTKIKIGDDIICEIQDRTNSRYFFRLDILMADLKEAKEWGRQIKFVSIVK